MVQQGQVFKLGSVARDGGELWTYRYRTGGRDSKRVQQGGFRSEADARAALERALEKHRRRRRVGRRLTLAEFVDEYLAQHEVSPVTLTKLRFLLSRAVQTSTRARTDAGAGAVRCAIMVVVRVDERPVDVEDPGGGGRERHRHDLTGPDGCETRQALRRRFRAPTLSCVEGAPTRRERGCGGWPTPTMAVTVASRLLSLGVLVLMAAACGAETVPPDESAADEGSSPDTARVESVVHASGSGGEEFRTSGEVDFARGRSSYVDSATGCRTIMIEDVSYTELPSELGLPSGKRWVKYSGVKDGADLEAEFEKTQRPQTDADGTTSFMLFATPDPPPAEYLAYLRRHADLNRIGEEEVRGVPTTRYRTTVDPDQLTREHLEQRGWKDANIETYLQQTSETEEKIEVWVDAADRTRRVVTTSSTDLEQFGVTHRSVTVTTTEYFDFGSEIEIVAPPDTEVLDQGEWGRINEERMKAEQGEAAVPFDSLPNAFAPSVQPSCKG